MTVNYYSSNLISKLINSIESQANVSYQLIVVNNSPEDQNIYQLRSQTVKVLDTEANLGFGRACNLGLQWVYEQDKQAIIWLINPDAYLLENSFEQALAFFPDHPEVSLLGTAVYTPSGNSWFAGGCFVPRLGAILTTDLLSANPELDYIPCDWVSGCSFLVNLTKFSECPQFDPAYFLYYDDFDFCQRYKSQGHLIAITQKIAVIHQPSSITNRNITNKFKHSTYSYFLALSKYSNKLVFWLRFARLMMHALVLLPIKPKAALGKFYGTLMFCRNSLFKATGVTSLSIPCENGLPP